MERWSSTSQSFLPSVKTHNVSYTLYILRHIMLRLMFAMTKLLAAFKNYGQLHCHDELPVPIPAPKPCLKWGILLSGSFGPSTYYCFATWLPSVILPMYVLGLQFSIANKASDKNLHILNPEPTHQGPHNPDSWCVVKLPPPISPGGSSLVYTVRQPLGDVPAGMPEDI